MFNARQYVEEKYKDCLGDFEDDFGLNGLDRLWSCESEEEVDDLIGSYLD